MKAKILVVFFIIFFLVVVLVPLTFLASKDGGVKKSAFGELLTRLRGSFFSERAAQTSLAHPPEFLRVPILLYHYIEDNQDERDFMRTSMATRPYFFEKQMRYLAEHSYHSISLTDLKNALEGRLSLPEKPIIITFDDGFRDYYENAFPVLKKYNLKAIVFMIANHIGLSGNLTAGMLREMLDSGAFELGSHTLNHVWLSEVSYEEARREIFESWQVLSERFHYPVKHFAYPGGFEAPWVVDLVREAGYETAVSTRVGQRQTGGEIWRLKRLKVGNLGEEEFARLIEGKHYPE